MENLAQINSSQEPTPQTGYAMSHNLHVDTVETERPPVASSDSNVTETNIVLNELTLRTIYKMHSVAHEMVILAGKIFILQNNLPMDWPVCPCEFWSDYDYINIPDSHIGFPAMNVNNIVKAHLIILKSTDPVFIHHDTLFAINNLSVKQVCLCVNTSLYIEFKKKCSELELQLNDPNIKSVYHTSSCYEMDRLYTEGMDQRLSKTGYFGRGIYGTDCPLKANAYYKPNPASPESTYMRCMLVVKFAMGNPHIYNHGESCRTLLRETPPYNSVYGVPMDYPEYVIYNNNQAYINLVIFYQDIDPVANRYALIRQSQLLKTYKFKHIPPEQHPYCIVGNNLITTIKSLLLPDTIYTLLISLLSSCYDFVNGTKICKWSSNYDCSGKSCIICDTIIPIIITLASLQPINVTTGKPNNTSHTNQLVPTLEKHGVSHMNGVDTELDDITQTEYYKTAYSNAVRDAGLYITTIINKIDIIKHQVTTLHDLSKASNSIPTVHADNSKIGYALLKYKKYTCRNNITKLLTVFQKLTALYQETPETMDTGADRNRGPVDTAESQAQQPVGSSTHNRPCPAISKSPTNNPNTKSVSLSTHNGVLSNGSPANPIHDNVLLNAMEMELRVHVQSTEKTYGTLHYTLESLLKKLQIYLQLKDSTVDTGILAHYQGRVEPGGNGRSMLRTGVTINLDPSGVDGTENLVNRTARTTFISSLKDFNTLVQTYTEMLVKYHLLKCTYITKYSNELISAKIKTINSDNVKQLTQYKVILDTLLEEVDSISINNPVTRNIHQRALQNTIVARRDKITISAISSNISKGTTKPADSSPTKHSSLV